MGAEAMETESAPEMKPQPNGVVLFLRTFVQFLFAPFADKDPCGTPFTVRQCINLHKLIVPVIYVPMIYYFSNRDGGERSLTLTGKEYGPAAMVLLATHTVYGVAWVIKDVHFPDPSWRIPMTVLGFILAFIYPLGMYYLPMFCLMSKQCPGGMFANGDELGLLGVGLAFYLVGFFYVFCSDIQKHFVLKYQRPRSLISDGVFAHSRNPNYFGEVMLYIGYGIMSCTYITIPLFTSAWLIVFWPNMLAKEASMSRYPQFAAWKSRTGFAIPWLPGCIYDILFNGLNKYGITEDEALLA